MKKKVILMAAAAAVVFSACNKQQEKDNDSIDGQIVELNERLSLASDSKDSLIFLMSDIYSGIEEINVQEGLLYNLRGGAENDAQREEIIANLSRINRNWLNAKTNWMRCQNSSTIRMTKTVSW